MQQTVSPVSGGQQRHGANEGPTGSQGDGFTYHMVIDYSTTLPPISLNAVSSRDNAKENRKTMNEGQAHTGVCLFVTIGDENIVGTPYTYRQETVGAVHTDLAEGTSATSLVNRTFGAGKKGKPQNLTSTLVLGMGYGSTIDDGDWTTLESISNVLETAIWDAIEDNIVVLKVPSRANKSINQSISGLDFIRDGLLSERAFKSLKEWVARGIGSVDAGDFLPVWEDCDDLDEVSITLTKKQANEVGMDKGATTVGEVIRAAASLMTWTPYGESDGTERGTTPLAGLKSASN